LQSDWEQIQTIIQFNWVPIQSIFQFNYEWIDDWIADWTDFYPRPYCSLLINFQFSSHSQIVAVILVDTGIALLAYMDGINDSTTLASVVFSALSGAGYAVFRVMFRKMIGDPQLIGAIAFTFTIIGIINAALLWPVCLILFFSEIEFIPWEMLIIVTLLIASVLMLMFHILTQFSGAVTYTMFVTLGLITSVPVSACECHKLKFEFEFIFNSKKYFVCVISPGYSSIW
jgi:vacuolar-type H+-ATPase subunit I/STV1